VVVPCTLSYPAEVSAADGIVAIWYKDYDAQKTVVYHSAAQEVGEGFGGRTQLVGDPGARNCTLLLRGVTPEDSGPYRFRFEIVNGDRWSAARDVTLSVSGGLRRRDPRPIPSSPLARPTPTAPRRSLSPDDLEQPSTSTSEEQTEGQTSTLECSTPYVCPPGDVALRWEGYDPRVATLSDRVQVDTSGVGHHLTLTTAFSWKDHSKKLLCEVSYGSQKATGEVVLRVRRTWGGSARGWPSGVGGTGPPPRPGPPPAAHRPGAPGKKPQRFPPASPSLSCSPSALHDRDQRWSHKRCCSATSMAPPDTPRVAALPPPFPAPLSPTPHPCV